jgi:hypothetical protein
MMNKDRRINPVNAWRLNKERLNPLSKNPGLFKKMHQRQLKIRNGPEVPSNFERYQKKDNPQPPRTRN